MSNEDLAFFILLSARLRRLIEKELERSGKTEEEILEGTLSTLGEEGAALRKFLEGLT